MYTFKFSDSETLSPATKEMAIFFLLGVSPDNSQEPNDCSDQRFSRDYHGLKQRRENLRSASAY